MKVEQTKTMKEIFVVDAGLEISPVQVSLSDWEHPSGFFGAKIGSQRIIALRGGWNKVITYAGFETRQEAEEFKATMTALKDCELSDN